ncbi:MAG TPA: hypothetical protein VEL11_03170 [Candidatus Bathyarchaeia archaeon]|nr:hypothetical protein [Candidatus Bathyarchaeia archaeon]
MTKANSKDDTSASEVISRYIAELTDWRGKDCSRVKLVVKRMLIEMLLLISLTGLWDIFPK